MIAEDGSSGRDEQLRYLLALTYLMTDMVVGVPS